MHILLILLILGLFLHDGFATAIEQGPRPDWPWLLAAVLGPKVALVLGYWALCRRALGRLGKRGAQRAMIRLDRAGGLYRLLAVASYGLDLYLGLLLTVRAGFAHVLPFTGTGDLILLDELAVLAPTVVVLALAWWCYYPIERRWREAALIGRLDAGLPIYPVWTRGQFVLAQVRHHMALVLVPLLLIFTWSQTIDALTSPGWRVLGHDPRPVLMFAGAVGVFLSAPLIIRHVWDTVPLPAGELRDRLLAMCERHRVGVRELLLWRTFGGMINAAVMGLIAPLRYILLTDALVEMVRREEVEAVMAHELAHVCRHHMFWLLAAAIGALGLLEVIFGLLLVTLVNAGATAAEAGGARLAGVGLDAGLAMLNTAEGMTAATVTMAGAAWLLVFGWVSRRIERQADTFAVQHLATARPDPERDAGGRVLVDRASAEVMIAALQQVAVLNHVPVQKRSWRHGSIAWRQAHLRRTVGQPIDALAIDRQMFWIKVASAASILLVIAFYAGVSMLGA